MLAVFLLVSVSGISEAMAYDSPVDPTDGAGLSASDGGNLFPLAGQTPANPSYLGPSQQVTCAPEHVEQQTACTMTPNSDILPTGNKVLVDVDFSTGHLAPLQLVRTFNSTTPLAATNQYPLFGSQWNTQFDTSIRFSNGQAYAVRPDGSMVIYNYNSTDLKYESFSPDADNWIASSRSGYALQFKSGAVENYSSSGRLLSFFDAHGLGWTLQYGSDPNRPTGAVHTNGQSMSFTYTAGLVTQVTDPAGNVYTYGYNSNGALTSVTYPSHSRTYYYEELDLLPDSPKRFYTIKVGKQITPSSGGSVTGVSALPGGLGTLSSLGAQTGVPGNVKVGKPQCKSPGGCPADAY